MLFPQHRNVQRLALTNYHSTLVLSSAPRVRCLYFPLDAIFVKAPAFSAMPPELSTRPKYGDIHDKNEERYSICPPTVHYFQQIFDRWWLTPTMHPTFGHLNDALAHTIRWDFIEDRTYFGLRDNRVKIFVIHKHIEGQGLDMSTLIGVLAFVWVEGFPTDTQGRNCYKRSAQAFELRDPLVFGAEQIRRVYPNDQLPGYWCKHANFIVRSELTIRSPSQHCDSSRL